MNSSHSHAGQVLRGPQAGTATLAQFSTDLRRYAAGAESQAEVTARAQAAGYAAGWAEGRQVAAEAARADALRVEEEINRLNQENQAQAEELEAAVRQAIAALASAANRLDQRATPGLEELEQTVVSAAFALADAVVGRELATATEPGLEAIARVLGAAPASGTVTVRLAPQDLATITEIGGVPGQLETGGRTVLVTADPTLRTGDAVAQCDATTVDARVNAALDRIREVMFGAAE